MIFREYVTIHFRQHSNIGNEKPVSKHLKTVFKMSRDMFSFAMKVMQILSEILKGHEY